MDTKLFDINFKDLNYHQTLLVLAIANKKDKAFSALLESGADPNVICGTKGDITPLITAIDFSENCNLFYVRSLLKYGAKVNFELTYQENGYTKNKLPLLKALDINDNEGNECLGLTKLLVSNGANLNSCSSISPSDHCEGVIEKCLRNRCIESLRYFLVEKHVPVPDTMYFSNKINPKTNKIFTIEEIVNTDEYTYEDSEAMNQAKKDVLVYLKALQKK